MKIFIITVVTTGIIASISYLIIYKYIKSKFERTANDPYANDRAPESINSSNSDREAQRTVSEQEIVNLESSIDKKLPEFYKNFLMNYPKDIMLLGAPYNTVSELSLPNTTTRIAELNSLEFVPADILVIGEDGLGNVYYNILSDNNSVIYLFDHEAPKYLNSGQNVIDWYKSWDLKFNNLDEMISYLKESFSE